MADRAPAPRPANIARRTAGALGAVLLLTLLANTLRLAKLPLRKLLKDDLSLDPEQTAAFLAIVGLAWYLKPLAGLLSDHVILCGTRRRHYLLLSGGAGALAWLVAGVASHQSGLLLVTLIGVNLFVVLGNAAAGGLLVDVGRAHGAMPLLSAVRLGAMNLAALLAGPIGGWLAAHEFAWTSLAGAAMTSMVALVAFSSLEREPPRVSSPLFATLRDIAVQLKDRRIGSVALLTLGFYVAPGFQTLWFFHQRDALGLSVQEIGLLEAMQAIGGCIGATCYAIGSRRLPLRVALPAGIVLSGACVALYALYNSFTAGLVLEVLIGFCMCVGVLPLCELSARASPPRHEAFVFAAIFGLGNAAMALADVLGTWLSKELDLDLATLFGVYALCTAVSAVLVLTVPRSLLDQERR